MNSTEDKLKERIKELTCLYDVTSIIVNADYNQLETSLRAIVQCLKKAWLHKDDAEAYLSCNAYEVKTDAYKPTMVSLKSDIKVFNKIEGYIKVGYPKEKYSQSDFLEEEQILLASVSLAVGNLLERKQIRDSEAAVKRQMEHTDRLYILGEITAGIAHELNTPLANILGFAELLKERMVDKQAIQDLEKIVDNAIFSREIVKKLMFFACEMPQEMHSLHVNSNVESVLELLKPSLHEKNIKVNTSFSHDDIQLRADTVQLTQVLFNMIMNAIYYSPENGVIGLDIQEKEKNIEISISDQGKGIDPENETKVFEPFFTTKPHGEGSGLGLSVVHGIITSHKGTITHRPNTPKGTIFIIDFPKL
ncbi:sensor histidine kinase [Maribacter thermophilus]|uniref:sensor histidine kinase n=1 Tax=Maribacter thermophilus TaxID=1197874 RepID=UPI000640FE0F|nr:HAMP domain-containing sensor histidine kinase [Maribacter thermophilus]